MAQEHVMLAYLLRYVNKDKQRIIGRILLTYVCYKTKTYLGH
jgi:hypothetical protein